MTVFTRSRSGDGFTDSSGLDSIGPKAANLAWLQSKKATVPRTWIVADSKQVASLDLPEARFAVRSSAASEDSIDSARAGVFLTELDVERHDVPRAVEHVLASNELSDSMAVIVQEMVDPVISGVAFSRNPVTGLSDIVVEAIRGRGDALLQDGATPMRCVWRNGEFVEPPEDEMRELADEVVAETNRLAASFGPADLEWVWDGETVYWVQIRPITAIADVPLYSRRIAKDVMPGMIKPLVWSVNVPMVNEAWVRLFTEAIGPNELEPETLARSFAHRSYFDMRAIGDIFELVGMPRDSLENLLGLPGARGSMRPGVATMSKLPRLTLLGWKLLTGGSRIEDRRRSLHAELTGYAASDVESLDDAALLEEIEELIALGTETSYINIVQPILANLHTRRLAKALESKGLGLEDVGSLDFNLWDPSAALADLAHELRRAPQDVIDRATRGELDALDEPTRRALDDVLDRFGYLSDNANDLSSPRWSEDPAVVVRLALASIDGHRAEQQAEIEPHSRSIRRLTHRARRYAQLRDGAGATFAYGYSLLRPRFLEVGRRMAGAGVIESASDVFFLDRGTVEGALGQSGPGLRAKVEREKANMDATADLVMPDLIVGDSWVPVSEDVSDTIVGVGVSRGRYRGTARYVQDLTRSDRLGADEILVIESSDMAWTPLFHRAGAVISEGGGILSHASITAREMGLPCVASAANARALDGRTVLVDGSTGEVFVEN